MEKLERRLVRLWHRISGKKRREKRQKKNEALKNNLIQQELTANHITEENHKLPSNQNCVQNQKYQIVRNTSPSQNLSLALIKIYAFARLKSLHNLMMAESSPPSNNTVITDLDNLELTWSADQFPTLSSSSQLSPRTQNEEFNKLCLSHESGYMTSSPKDYSSSLETLLQQRSPSLHIHREISDKMRFTPQEKSHSSYDDITDSSALLSGYSKLTDPQLSCNVYKSKCVTSVFEAANAGLEVLIDDILAEFNRWFVGKKMFIVASELHFSVPLSKRCRKREQILKQQMLHLLHENNRRILSLNGSKGILPVYLVGSKTEENIYTDNELQAIQGVYQRCYRRLLPFVHAETPSLHASYWKLLESPIRPNPSDFLFNDENSAKLRTHSLVSFNIIGLSFHGIKHKSCDILG